MPSQGQTQDLASIASASYSLPVGPNATVIAFDYEGGQTPRQSAEPLLLIRADHTLILGAPYGKRKRIESKIDKEKLQSLLHFILAQQQFAKLDAKKIQQEIDIQSARKQVGTNKGLQRRMVSRIMDAPTTKIRVNAERKTHKVDFYALGMTAKRHPEIPSLQQLYAIKQRLQREMSMAALGGLKRLKSHLALINNRLAEKAPDIEPLTTDNLEMALVRADGTLWMQWRKLWNSTDGSRKGKGLDGFVTVPQNGETEIKINLW